MKTIYRKDDETIDQLISRYRTARKKEGIPNSLERQRYHVKPAVRRRQKHAAMVEKLRKEAANKKQR